MQRRLWLIALFCLAAVPAAAQRTPGEQEENEAEKKDEGPKKFIVGERAPEPQAEQWLNSGDQSTAPSLEKLRGRLVAYYFFRTDGTPAESIRDVVALQKKFAKSVAFIGFTVQPRDQAEAGIRGKQVTFPVGCGSKMEEKFAVVSPPCIYLLDTGGRFVSRFHPGDDMETKIQAQMEKTPPRDRESQAVRNRKLQAQKALSAKQVGRAYTIAKELKDLVDAESGEGKNIGDLLKKIEDEAQKLLSQARDKARADKTEDKEAACKTLAELKVRFAGEAVGGEADTELGRLRGDVTMKSKVAKAIDNARGELNNDQAADHEASKRYLEALRVYREVTENTPDTDAAKAAEAAIDRIANDPDAQKHIANLWADEEAERWLGLADAYAKVELYDRARSYYQRIIDTHPTARATAKAKERLAKLPEEKPEADVPEETASAAEPAETGKDGGPARKPGDKPQPAQPSKP